MKNCLRTRLTFERKRDYKGEKMDRFVVGFAFSKNCKFILLVKKNRPKWQAGCLNGIGGKIEKGEQPIETMERETKEEANLDIEWTHRAVMKGINNDGNKFECHVFYAYTDDIRWFEQREDEMLIIIKTANLIKYKRITNLDYLIPFGMCKEKMTFMTINYNSKEYN